MRLKIRLYFASFFYGLISAAVMLHQISLSAHADLEFKKKVIDNCEQAIATLKALDQKAQIELIPDLKLLLNLESAKLEGLKPDTTGNKLGQFDSPFEELRGQDIWKSFQPNRDIRVKRCAVEILALLSPYSIATTPDLIKLSSDKSLPNDFRMLIDETIAAITVKAAQSDQNLVTPEIFRELVELLRGETTIRTENVLLELRELTVKFLVSEIQKPDAALRDRIVEGLLRIDDSGAIVGKGVLTLLGSADDGLRRRAAQLLGELESIASESVPALIERLNDLSPEVEDGAASALANLYSTDDAAPKVTITPQQVGILLNAFERAKPPTREQIRVVLGKLGHSNPSISEKAIAFLKSSDPSLRAAAARLLGSFAGTNPEAMNGLFVALQDKIPQVRFEAIDALANLKGSPQIVNAFAKLLKENAKDARVDVKLATLDRTAKAVSKLKLGGSASSLVQYFVDALRINDPLRVSTEPQPLSSSPENISPSEDALVSIGKESVPALTKALANKDASLRRRSARALATIRPPEAAALTALSQLLRDADLRKQAAAWLIAIGKVAIPETLKIYRSPNLPAKLEAAKILLALGEKDKALYALVLDSVRKEGCEGKAALTVDVPSIREYAPASFFEELIDCLSTSPTSGEIAVQALIAAAPLPPAAHPKLFQYFSSREVSKKTQLQMLEKALIFGLPSDQLVSLMVGSLKESDKPIQFRILSILKSMGDAAKGGIPELLKFFQDSKDDRLLSNEAALALTVIDQKSFDYVDFFRKELAEDGFQWAQNSLRKLPSIVAQPVLDRALADLPLDKKCRVIELIGETGENSQHFSPQLMPLTNSPDERLGYCATVALLKIDPANPELSAPLRRELRGDYRKDLLADKFPEKLLPTLEGIASGSSSYVERKIASLLMRKIKK